jgi:Ca-activated chloride channel family protein
MNRRRRVGLVAGMTVVITILALLYPLIARGAGWLEVSFQYKWFLLLLLLIPLVFWAGTFGQDGRKPRLRIGMVAPLLAGPRGIRAHLRDLPGVLRAVALLFLIVAMARPVSVLRDQTGDQKGIDIILALDLSGSMRAILEGNAKDLPGQQQTPQPAGKRLTRIETAKLVIRDFIRRRKSDRIGVVVFGKDAYVLSPPTLDYYLLDQMVAKMTLGIIDGNATAIGDALGTAVARIRKSDARSKAIILLTDGDSNAGSISPDYAAHLATTIGCKVYTIQIGTGEEVDVEEGTNLLGQVVYGRGRFPVNPALLHQIAKETGGEAYIATDGKALADSMHKVLDSLEKTNFEASIGSFEDLFQLLLIPGVFLIGLDAVLRAWLLRRFP